MKKIFSILFVWMLVANAEAQECSGTITEIHRWDSFDTFSIMISGANSWISMPTKSDEAMALVAFTTGKPVLFNWVDNTESCTDGWVHNTKFVGWWKITH